MKNVTGLMAALLLTGGLFAQDLTSPLYTDSWQAAMSNPALHGYAPRGLTIGLPGLSNDLSAENVSYNDLLLTENGQRILDLTQLPDQLDERNYLRNDFTLETIGVGIRGDRFSFGLHHRVRVLGETDYPRDLIEVIARGNAQFIGQTVEIAPLGAATSFHELGLGVSFQASDRVYVGARIKYLSGIADIRTGPTGSLRLTTDERNFALSLEQDLTINTAGTIDFNGLEDIGVNYDLNRIETDDIFSENNGISFDLGVFVDLDDLRLQASVQDLVGRVDWATEVSTFRLTGTDEFTGLDVLRQVFEDSLSFNGALDSLRETFEPTEITTPYRTDLNPTFLIGGEYDFTDRWSAGLLLVHYGRTLQNETAVALIGRYKVLKQLTVGLNTNYRRDSPFNLGAHLFGQLGPLQLMASTDDLLTVFQQRSSSRAGVRLGAALSIGSRRKDPEPRRPRIPSE
ncbi:DUF5723 family protein [Lewinella sp. W8]|uniref:DUF5723 family protein n=1 Tax=Lewinella sp. W8 TaxID=2528208 RepID=UPI0010671DBF|nr:DUF5723 family protein [Lewinella sp. W8]MTB53958.1 hypothetical protein [Lewinella sp. W8]